MPNVIGLTESAASNAIIARGIAYEFTEYTTVGATPQNNGYVQSQSPGAGTYVGSCNFGYNATLVLYLYTAPTTTTAAPTTTTTTAAPQCVCTYSDQGNYYFAPQCCPAGAPYTGLPGGFYPSGSCCPNIYKPVATTTTTSAPSTTSRPLTYWKCNSADVRNPSNPCGYVGQCLYDGNTYFPAGC
jgi:hypothetical protein